MIILRQKLYADQDYAGVTTYKQARNIKENRGMLAGMKRWGQQRNKRWLGKQQAKVAGLGLNEREAAVVNQNLLETYNKRNDRMQGRMERRLKTATTLATPGATIGGQNSGGTYNKITTKNTPTATYKRTHPKPQQTTTPNVGTGAQPQQTMAITTTQPQTTQQKQGMGTMGKVAIGAGVAAAGYGAYRMLKARKERKEAEEEQENRQRRQA
jgi:hypothetical protein